MNYEYFYHTNKSNGTAHVFGKYPQSTAPVAEHVQVRPFSHNLFFSFISIHRLSPALSLSFVLLFFHSSQSKSHNPHLFCSELYYCLSLRDAHQITLSTINNQPSFSSSSSSTARVCIPPSLIRLFPFNYLAFFHLTFSILLKPKWCKM